MFINFVVEVKAVAIAICSGAMEADTISKHGRSSKIHTSRRNMMRRTFLSFAVFCISMANMLAQDIITMKNGDEIQAIVQDIGTDEMKYKRFDNPNGPTYSLKISRIVSIQYANGSKDVFAESIAKDHTPMPAITDQVIKSQQSQRCLDVLSDFESRMKERGFTKRIVVYDFLKNKKVSYCTYTVGAWINYQKQLVTVRIDRDTWDEIDIPFDMIQKVEIIENGVTVTSGRVGFFGGVNSQSKEVSKGLQVRIVVGDISSGTNAYILKLFDPLQTIWSSPMYKSDPIYRSIQECANSIVDEINNIILYVGR